MKKIELLAPAGNLEKLKIAVLYGADAVFIGGKRFSLRSRASNFTLEDIKAGCEFAHKHSSKVHVTCNIVMHENDTNGIIEYMKDLEAAGVDAVIASSPTILSIVKAHTCMEAHVSTQCSTQNSKNIKFYEENGFDRVVLAREVSLKEMKVLREKSKVEIEAFIHGGMCVSYSGRCVLSNNMTNRDANRGGCAHSCRWNYNLYVDDTKKNCDGYFAMSSKDLCSISYIPYFIDAKIDSLKIEGRMKSLHYIASVVKAYRYVIDTYYEKHSLSKEDINYAKTLLESAENRQTSKGFLEGETGVLEQLYDHRSEIPTQEFVGIVLDYDKTTKLAKIEERNFFLPNSTIEVLSPNSKLPTFKIENIYDESMNVLDAARHPRQILYINSDIELKKYDMLRVKK